MDHEQLDLQLEIVGDGPARDAVARHIEDRGLGSRVHLMGRRGGEDLVEAYDRADIFVMTSLSESFGTVLVEAMARGVPVIAPDISGVRDVVIDGEAGLAGRPHRRVGLRCNPPDHPGARPPRPSRRRRPGRRPTATNGPRSPSSAPELYGRS